MIGANDAGNETVNDIASEHYTFDQRALGQQDLTTSKGEMWVASDGGDVIKYVLSTKADATYFGEGIDGTLTMDYELTGANKPVKIQLPVRLPAGDGGCTAAPGCDRCLELSRRAELQNVFQS